MNESRETRRRSVEMPLVPGLVSTETPCAATRAALVFSFGDYQLDTARFELRWRGRRRPVQPKVFDLLAHLIAHRHRVVSHAELRATVWAGLLVCPDALTYSVSAARRALGDNGQSQRFVRSVRGRGYQFVGDVEGGGGPAQGGRPAACCPMCGAP